LSLKWAEKKLIIGKLLPTFFRKITGTWKEIQPDSEPFPYVKVLKSFADEIIRNGKSIADGREGRKSLLLSNAIYLSSWKKAMVSIPPIGSAEEIAFEEEFEAALKAKTRKSL
jgi:hypothetical protein